MTKPSNIASIEKTTNLSWDAWLAYLDGINAKDLPHKEIAEHIRGKLQPQLDNAGWWAQNITVAYEQHIGRREPGQRSDGTYEVAVSKSMASSMDEAMQHWLKLVKNATEFSGVALAAEPTMTTTDKNQHWGVNLEDSTRVNADVNSYAPPKIVLTVTHTKLKSSEAAEKWRAFWKDFFNQAESA